MIKSFGHKGLEVFFETGSKAGIQANHADRLRLQLSALDKAKKPEDMNAPNWRLHPLHNKNKLKLEGHFGVWVSGNWRLTFKFDGENAILVDYMDYH
jgi:proteic killer suppression protein